MGIMLSLNDYAYEKILDAVNHAIYRPGQKLIVRELSEQLEISPTPIKEALNRLVSDGIVETVPRRGFVLPKLSRKRIIDTLETRRILEKSIVPLAVRNAEDAPDTIAHLKELLRAFDAYFLSSKDDNDYLQELETDFHISFATLTGNEVLVELYKKCLNISSLFMIYNIFGIQHKEESAVNNHHQDYVTGILNKDEELIINAIDKAIDHNRTSIEMHIKNAAPEHFMQE